MSKIPTKLSLILHFTNAPMLMSPYKNYNLTFSSKIVFCDEAKLIRKKAICSFAQVSLFCTDLDPRPIYQFQSDSSGTPIDFDLCYFLQ